MALVWPLLLGLAVAPLLGGRWSLLGQIRIRGAVIFYVAIVLQFAAFPLRWMPWHTPDRAAIVLWIISYALFALGLLLNARIPGVPFVAIGLVSNVLAISLNGGHMPALPSALRGAGLIFTKSQNSERMPTPHLAWLVDRWAAPRWIPGGNVFSVGDVAIAAGGLLFALLATECFRRRPGLKLAPHSG
ncbi:MAG TPA: DUF5317 domain-containing protein [Gaiellaceae bacterium]|nr:DUF5317 domain-containing protein [Gaiellaceae bacterium]